MVSWRLFRPLCSRAESVPHLAGSQAGDHDDKPEFALEPKLFGKWSYDGVECNDISLAAYLQVKTVRQQVYIPYTQGRYQQRRFKKV
jgi:hypothetical protein